ncbi:hypothetical protein GCM10009735_85730 [Actinomadura chokoriensis]
MADDSDKAPPTSSYVIDAIEYVRDAPLPPNALFDDPAELTRLLDRTRKSIESQPASWIEPDEEAPPTDGTWHDLPDARP